MDEIRCHITRNMSDYHTPVLLKETIEGLDIQPGKKYIDATLGGAGHSLEIDKKGGILLSIDTDSEAIANAQLLMRNDQLKNWIVIQANFRDIEERAKKEG